MGGREGTHAKDVNDANTSKTHNAQKMAMRVVLERLGLAAWELGIEWQGGNA